MNIRLLIGIGLIVWFSSCQKELSQDKAITTQVTKLDTITPKADTSFLVKTTVEKRNGDSTVTNFTYDTQGRVTSAISSNGQSKMYAYSEVSYTVDDYTASKITMHELYLLNSSSLIDSAVYFGTTDTTSEKYTYNTSRQLLKVAKYHKLNGTFQPTEVTSAEYDANGNIVKDVENSQLTIYYSYTNLNYTLNMGLVYQAKYRRNFVKTYTYTGSTNLVLDATYTFDNFNRLSSETLTNTANGQVLATTIYRY